MMTHAYSQLYLNKTSRAIGNMLHAAVVEFGISGADFLEQFIQTGTAKHFENGSPAEAVWSFFLRSEPKVPAKPVIATS